MKHYIAALLALVMMLALAGCHTDVEKMDISETVVETTVLNKDDGTSSQKSADATKDASKSTKASAGTAKSSSGTTKSSAAKGTTRTYVKSTTKATTAKGVTGTTKKSTSTTVTEDIYEGSNNTTSVTQQSGIGTGVASDQ